MKTKEFQKFWAKIEKEEQRNLKAALHRLNSLTKISKNAITSKNNRSANFKGKNFKCFK
jgi:hypothetical protein